MLIDDASVQRFLQRAGAYSGVIDGKFGPQSVAASRAFLAAMSSADTSYATVWSDARVRVAVEQAMMESIGQDLGRIDGLDGPRTQIALERWQDFVQFDVRAPAPRPQPTVWPKQAQLKAFYGAPGTNHTRITPPYQVYYGDTPVSKILINQRCAESASRILAAVLAHYGRSEVHRLGLDRFGGCYNNRPMRNGTQLSTHAFACAWDWDPARNPLRATSRTAQFARPEYAGFIDAHEAEGWVSLGRERNFDWMHFQACSL